MILFQIKKYNYGKSAINNLNVLKNDGINKDQMRI